MVQIIEEQPSFAQIMARGGGKAAASGIMGTLQGLEGRRENESVDKLTGLNLKGIQDPEFRKQLLAAHLKGSQQQASNPAESEFFKEQYGVDINQFSPEFRKQLMGESAKNVAKSQKQAAEKAEDLKGLEDTLNWLDENIEYTGTSKIPGFKSFTFGGLRRDVVQKREEFDRAGFMAADKVFTHFNKGVVNKDKLKVIQNDMAPRAGLSERVNKARIAALRRTMNLPSNAPSSVVNKQIDKEVKALKKIEAKEGEQPEKVKMVAPNGKSVSMDPNLVEEALSRGWQMS